MQSNETRLVLDKWVIHHDKSSIESGDDVVHLEPKVMEVLVYLVNNANRVISREELTTNVWQSKYTSDEVITRAISVLRKKLGDTGKVHKYIKTIPKHGYILELPNDKAEALEPSSPNVQARRKQRNRMLRYFILLLSVALLLTLIIIAVLSHKLVNLDSEHVGHHKLKIVPLEAIYERNHRNHTALYANWYKLSTRLSDNNVVTTRVS